ncbi:hypothetical protein [Streptomyces marincola]|uniref:Uncharacterized protein n=1 Tax=Streptomyces marincola TaxID=2878388 RepID=A0A1W7CY43_9ACTN|nr:hypothetical protein [Streptomyces marincola]ARQ69666.1 hypothetical protein CAG99_13010 [Streptomyces marincola]
MGSFDEEWAQLQAAARDEQLATRLNTSEGGGAGGAGPSDGLTARTEAQRRAADLLETEILPDARREGDRPVDDLDQAAGRMSGWACAAGLRTASEVWAGKVERLTNQLRAEAGALRDVATGFAGNELETMHQFGQLGYYSPYGQFGPYAGGMPGSGLDGIE